MVGDVITGCGGEHSHRWLWHWQRLRARLSPQRLCSLNFEQSVVHATTWGRLKRFSRLHEPSGSAVQPLHSESKVQSSRDPLFHIPSRDFRPSSRRHRRGIPYTAIWFYLTLQLTSESAGGRQLAGSCQSSLARFLSGCHILGLQKQAWPCNMIYFKFVDPWQVPPLVHIPKIPLGRLGLLKVSHPSQLL